MDKKRLDLHMSPSTYEKLLQLISLQMSGSKKHISQTALITSLIEKEYERRIK